MSNLQLNCYCDYIIPAYPTNAVRQHKDRQTDYMTQNTNVTQNDVNIWYNKNDSL